MALKAERSTTKPETEMDRRMGERPSEGPKALEKLEKEATNKNPRTYGLTAKMERAMVHDLLRTR